MTPYRGLFALNRLSSSTMCLVCGLATTYAGEDKIRNATSVESPAQVVGRPQTAFG